MAQTKLIAELEKQTTGITVVTKEGFAHELLAVEYAGWISPVFRLHVNQTFIDYRTGKRNENRYGCWWATSPFYGDVNCSVVIPGSPLRMRGSQ
ncbi:TPA: KilA-N domain-containing protein, partial [Escherichia coli]|nr:KilA-N domain-containing protein [Escherichia coli]